MKEQAIVVPRSRTFQLASSKAIDPAGGKSNKPLGAIAKPLRGSQGSLAATATNSHNPNCHCLHHLLTKPRVHH
jgi:hypothetical protein